METEKVNHSTNISKSFAKGALAGTFSSILLQPFDLLKSRLQYYYIERSDKINNVKNRKLGQSTDRAIETRAAKVPTTTTANMQAATLHKVTVMKLLKTIIKNEGVFSLWNGIGPSLIRVCGGVGIYFSSLELMSSYIDNKNKKSSIIPNNNNMASTFMIGATARSLAGVTMLPITVVKTRFEAQPANKHGYKSTFNALSRILKNESWSGLYRGLIPTLIRDVPFSGIYLVLYQNLRVYASEQFVNNKNVNDNNNALPSHINFSIGFVAGSIATALTHPFDVIKTRMQVATSNSSSKPMEKVSSYFKDIYTKEGSVGLGRGLFLRVIKRPLSTAVIWTVYEALKD